MEKPDTPTLRAFALLEYLVQAGSPVSLTDMADDMGMPCLLYTSDAADE